MKIAGKEFPNAKVGDKFFIVETATDRFTDYISQYVCLGSGNYRRVYDNYGNITKEVKDFDLILDLEMSQHGIQFADLENLALE